jgi:hypothetical protein
MLPPELCCAVLPEAYTMYNDFERALYASL